MAQLTGSQFGTGQNDSFVGDVNAVDLTESTIDSGILFANVNAFGGDDNVEGIATLTSPATVEKTDSIELIGYGIQQSLIDTGSGNDTVTGRGSVLIADESFSFLDRRAVSYGFARGSLNGRGGEDRFVFTGDAISNDEAVAVGLSTATVDGGSGNDTIALTANASARSPVDNSSQATGVENSTVRGGGGQDTVTVQATGDTSGRAVGVENSFVSGGKERDRFTISAEIGGGSQTESIGLSASQIYGGFGDDSINISANGSATGRGSASTTVIGIDNNSIVNGGRDNDSIKIEASGGISARNGGSTEVYGAKDSRVLGGLGDDTIELKGEGRSFFGNTIYGASNTTVNGGAGNDAITFTATADGPGGVFGLFQSRAVGGDGDDVITAITQNATGAGSDVGMFESRVNGGNGNDRIVANSESGEFDIQDTIIGGGDGDDTFDVGVGSGTIRGGAGNDIAILDFFDFETMSLSTINNGGLRITGTQNKKGRSVAWTQNIFEVEQFQIGEIAGSADALATRFAS